jgi:hypothetical protein
MESGSINNIADGILSGEIRLEYFFEHFITVFWGKPLPFWKSKTNFGLPVCRRAPAESPQEEDVKSLPLLARFSLEHSRPRMSRELQLTPRKDTTETRKIVPSGVARRRGRAAAYSLFDDLSFQPHLEFPSWILKTAIALNVRVDVTLTK